eukprot:m.45139 g.45139  ORF g.45139 m.45139 type:complete len:299 (-) comp5859_c0_seq1:299-1195(-)
MSLPSDVQLLLRGYKNPQLLEASLKEVVSQFQFTAGQGHFCFNDGSDADLIRLYGDLIISPAVSVPLELYILRDFPEHAPYVYVRPPSSQVGIRATAVVDADGLVHLNVLRLDPLPKDHVLVSIMQSLMWEFGTLSPFDSTTPKLSEELAKESSLATVKVQERLSNLQQDQATLARRRDDAIARLRGDLQRDVSTVESSIRGYAASLDELTAILSSLPPPPTPATIDDYVMVPSPLLAQVLGLQAEDSALDECLLHLGFALQDGSIDLITYLRHVRGTAGRQFQVRELLRRALALITP